MKFVLITVVISIALIYLLCLYYLHKKKSEKLQIMLDAGYKMRESSEPIGSFGDSFKYEFFINDEWVDLETAYKHLET